MLFRATSSAFSGAVNIDSQRISYGADSLTEIGIQRHFTTGKSFGFNQSGDDSRIGDRGFGTALVVTHGTGIGAGTGGSDVEEAAFIDRCETATSGADAANMNTGDLRDVTENVVLCTEYILAVDYDRDVVAGAANIRGDQIGESGDRRER